MHDNTTMQNAHNKRHIAAMERKVGGNERARCYQQSPSNNKLPVRTFYFFLRICGRGGRGVPRWSGLPGVYHLLTDYFGGGGRGNDNLCTNLTAAKKYNSEGMKSIRMPIHLLSSPPGTRQVDISGKNTERLMSAPHGLNQR